MKKDKKDTSKLSISATKKIALKRLEGKRLRAFIPALLLAIFLIIPSLYNSCISTYIFEQANAEIINIDVSSIEDFVDSMSAFSKALESVKIDKTATIVNSAFNLFTFLFTGSIALSLAALGLKIIRNEKPTPATAFRGLKHFLQAFFISIWLGIFGVLITLSMIAIVSVVIVICVQLGSFAATIAGIVVCVLLVVFYIYIMTRFQLAYFIAADNKDIKARHTIFTSFAMMRRRVWNYFFLDFSFIGWWILAAIPISLGIAALNYSYKTGIVPFSYAGFALVAVGIVASALVMSYQSAAEAVYYSTVSGNFKVAVSDQILDEEPEEELTPIDESEIPEPENPAGETDFSNSSENDIVLDEMPDADDIADETPSASDAVYNEISSDTSSAPDEKIISGSYDMNPEDSDKTE